MGSVPPMDLEQLERAYRERRRQHRHRNPTRAQLIETIEFLSEVIEWLFGHRPNPKRSLIMQVVINDQQYARLHGAEDNAEGAVVPTDQAVPAWTLDRDDLVTLRPVDGDEWSIDVVGVDGAAGDTVVTLTATEPANEDGSPGPVIPPLTQVVTVGPDNVVAGLAITADAPQPK